MPTITRTETTTNDGTTTVQAASFRAAGQTFIESDDADVDPLPEGTEVGDLSKLKESFGDFIAEARRVNASPERRDDVIDQFFAGWQAAS